MAHILQGNSGPDFLTDGSEAIPAAATVAAADTITFNRALAACAGLVLRKLPKPRFALFAAPAADIGDLNIRLAHSRNPVKNMVDVIAGHEDATINEKDVQNAIFDGDFMALPAVARAPSGAIAVNHCTQVAFIKRDDGKWNVVRRVTFQSDGTDGKVKPALASTHCHGDMHLIQYGSSLHNGKKVFQHVFEQLVGFQVRAWELQGGSAPRAAPNGAEVEDVGKGFDFIEEAWKTRSVLAQGLGQLRWIITHLKDATSPLHKWSERLVEKAFTKLREDGSLAKVVTTCPYTICTYRPWFVDTVLADLVPHMTVSSFGMIGKAGCGKTPVLEGVACMLSRFWMRKLGRPGTAIYRSAPDLDFFRGEVGMVDRPHCLDDADPRTVTPSKWKAFGDVGLVETMTRERWGASKWVRNQLRLFGFNPYDGNGDPEIGNKVPHDTFMKLLEPLWHKDMDAESKLAVLKRSCVVVITKEWLHWRAATQEDVDVRRVKLGTDATGGEKDLVIDSAKPVIRSWKEGALELPEDYEEQLEWEERWMNAVMSKGALPIPSLSPPPPPVHVLPDAAPGPFADPVVSSQSTVGEVARPTQGGTYDFPMVPVVAATSLKRARFVEGAASKKHKGAISLRQASSVGLSPASIVEPPRGALLQEARRLLKSESIGAATPLATPTATPRSPGLKHLKAESADAAAVSKQAEKVEVLRRELAEAERLQRMRADLAEAEDKLESLTQAVVPKPEPMADNAFHDLVKAFASETEGDNFQIEDSPVKFKPEPLQSEGPTLSPPTCIDLDSDECC